MMQIQLELADLQEKIARSGLPVAARATVYQR
jgi:hypothetical protein